MSNNQQLLHLLKIKEQALLEAASAWNRSKEQFSQNKLKHEQLASYRQEYIAQLNTLGNEGCLVGNLRNRINFIAQLDLALIQMSQQLASLAKQRSHFERLFLQAKAEQDAIIRLLQKRANEESKRVDKLEQKVSDEYAIKQWYSKKRITKANNRGD